MNELETMATLEAALLELPDDARERVITWVTSRFKQARPTAPVPLRGGGDELRTMRETAGLTRKVVAEMTGVSMQSLWRYESGRTKPNIHVAQLIREACGQ